CGSRRHWRDGDRGRPLGVLPGADGRVGSVEPACARTAGVFVDGGSRTTCHAHRSARFCESRRDGGASGEPVQRQIPLRRTPATRVAFARRTAVELPDEWCEGVGGYHAANGWRPKGLVLDQTYRRRNQSSRFNRARRLRVLAVRAAFMFVTSASRTHL